MRAFISKQHCRLHGIMTTEERKSAISVCEKCTQTNTPAGLCGPLLHAASLQSGHGSLLCFVLPYHRQHNVMHLRDAYFRIFLGSFGGFFLLLTYTWSIQDLAPSVVHPLQSDLHPNDSLRAIPTSPSWLPIDTHQSIITRPISPLIVQTMRASLLNLISPFYLLFTKNSLARLRNYVVITGAGGGEKKKYHRDPFSFVSVSEPPTFYHAPQIYASATGVFNGRLSARLWTSVEFSISSASPS